jgi:hypothetical protein
VSFAGLLRQSLVIERSLPITVGATSSVPEHPLLDGYLQQAYGWAAIATVAGSIQPRAASEVQLVGQGGAPITDTVIYLAPTDVTPADRIRRAEDATGPYYQITGVRDAAGRGHHLELDARRVG